MELEMSQHPVSLHWPGQRMSTSHWAKDGSRASVLRLGPHVMGLELAGMSSELMLEFLEPHVVDFLDESGAAQMFWDISESPAYEAGFRDGMIRMLMSRRSQWVSMHVLVKSAIISMTVSAVGLTFGGKLESYRDHGDFYAAVERALKRSG